MNKHKNCTSLLFCSDPSKLAYAQSDKKFLRGTKEFQIVLHHSGEFPAGAIAPVSLIFKPQTAGKKQQIGSLASDSLKAALNHLAAK